MKLPFILENDFNYLSNEFKGIDDTISIITWQLGLNLLFLCVDIENNQVTVMESFEEFYFKLNFIFVSFCPSFAKEEFTLTNTDLLNFIRF